MLSPTAAERPDYEASIVEIRSKIGDATFEAVFAKGLAMQIKEAIEFALALQRRFTLLRRFESYYDVSEIAVPVSSYTSW